MLEKPIRLEDLQLENWPNIILWAAPIMFLFTTVRETVLKFRVNF